MCNLPGKLERRTRRGNLSVVARSFTIDATRNTGLGCSRPYRIPQDAEQVVFRMNRYQWVLSTIAILASSASIWGCTPGGVGDPCIPEDEYEDGFSGYGVEEVNVEAMSFQCETRLCLVNHFQGRVSCPYGQGPDPASDAAKSTDPAVRYAGVSEGLRCKIPDGSAVNLVKVDVKPQLIERRASNSVYCSCRCDGPDKTARYCKCPSGYGCTLLNDIPLGNSGQLQGSYCVRNGTAYKKTSETGLSCNPNQDNTICGYEGYSSKENPFGALTK